MARRLVSADQDQHRLEDQVVVVEPRAVEVRVHDEADQILGLAAAAALDDLHDVLGVVDDGGPDFLTDLVASRRKDVGPVEELVVVVLGKAHQLADHEHRERRREILYEIAPREITASISSSTFLRRKGSWA